MHRVLSLVLAFSLLFLNGAAASRYCACIEAMGTPSCCEKQMPCCDNGECKMHPDASSAPDLALDLCKSVESVASLPVLSLQLPFEEVVQIGERYAPVEARVRGPDSAFNALRAPPVQA
jgi:hypothetical protein